MKTDLMIALAGNPNSGKTTLFNSLTGSKARVANYPGVTVEKKEGIINHSGKSIILTDLPGTYSLSAYSVEETVTRDVILKDKPNVVIDVIDSTNLERNLYLAIQLMELRAPLVLAFNMKDLLEKKGIKIDVKKLSTLLRVPIVEISASKNEGTKELLDVALEVASKGNIDYPEIVYGDIIEKAIESITLALKNNSKYREQADNYPLRWLAVKLLEADRHIAEQFFSQEVEQAIKSSSEEIEKLLGDSPEVAIASVRYGYITGYCKETMSSTIEERHSFSDTVDSILVNRVLGIPIFLILMYLLFQLTFTLGDPFMGWIEDFFAWAGDKIGVFLEDSPLLKSLIVDGIIGGVGGVVVFLPNIVFLFAGLAILEASGYMARVAFIMDKLMHLIGLHGKSFIPFLIGFGCSVPAVMSTRMLDSQRDRLITMLVTPFMSCGARLPIYLLIIPAFFKSNHGLILWIMYVVGIIVAILIAKLLGKTLLKGETTPFVMELPPYRVPTLRGVLTQMWERSWLYLKKAGTIILAISIVMWALITFPSYPADKAAVYEENIASLEGEVESKLEALKAAGVEIDAESNEPIIEEGKGNEEINMLMEAWGESQEKLDEISNEFSEKGLEYSIAGRIGKTLEPIFSPLGFDWKIVTAFLGAFAAKEVFVAQLGIVYSVGEADEESEPLREKLQAVYSPLIGVTIMLFALLSAPCMATFAIVKRESNSWKWPIIQYVGMMLVAYIIALLVFQIGRLLGF